VQYDYIRQTEYYAYTYANTYALPQTRDPKKHTFHLVFLQRTKDMKDNIVEIGDQFVDAIKEVCPHSQQVVRVFWHNRASIASGTPWQDEPPPFDYEPSPLGGNRGLIARGGLGGSTPTIISVFHIDAKGSELSRGEIKAVVVEVVDEAACRAQSEAGHTSRPSTETRALPLLAGAFDSTRVSPFAVARQRASR
jgi:hypothetical protein